jgi:cytochrome c biogenesis protein CcmG/thiol:disulfide interchange protein DsbE
MLKNRFQWTILLVLAGSLGLGWISFSRVPIVESPGPVTLTEAPLVGYLAPDFTAATPLGEEVNLAAVNGRNTPNGQPIVLNFWASWCGPCRVEMPYFQNAARRFNGRAAFIGVNQGEDGRTVTEFGNEYGITYPLLVDEQNAISRAYNINSLPTTIFIDSNGVVREVIIGAISQAVLEDRIEDLLTP